MKTNYFSCKVHKIISEFRVKERSNTKEYSCYHEFFIISAKVIRREFTRQPEGQLNGRKIQAFVPVRALETTRTVTVLGVYSTSIKYFLRLTGSSQHI